MTITEKNIPNISFHQYAILSLVYAEEITTTHLAEICGISKPSTLRSCSGLLKKGLIRKRIIRQDAAYSITTDGIKELERIDEFLEVCNPLNITV